MKVFRLMHFLKDRLLNMKVKAYTRVRVRKLSGLFSNGGRKKGLYRYIFLLSRMYSVLMTWTKD